MVAAAGPGASGTVSPARPCDLSRMSVTAGALWGGTDGSYNISRFRYSFYVGDKAIVFVGRQQWMYPSHLFF